MKPVRNLMAAACFIGVGGCAALQFSDAAPANGNALAFRTSEPYLAVTYNTDCKVAVSVVALPGRERFVALRSGMGASDLGVTFNNGMIASVTQKSDPQLPQLITALSTAGLFHLDGAAPTSCKAGAALFQIDEAGGIDVTKPLVLPSLDVLTR